MLYILTCVGALFSLTASVIGAYSGTNHGPRTAVRSLSSSIRFFDYHFLFSNVFTRQGDDSAQEKTQMTLAVAKALPSLQAVMARLHELAPAPFEGFSIVGKDNEPLTNQLGPCVYTTQEEAESSLSRAREQYPQGFPECRIVRVRVSLENGLQLL